jgi:hypothetical protein
VRVFQPEKKAALAREFGISRERCASMCLSLAKDGVRQGTHNVLTNPLVLGRPGGLPGYDTDG